MRHANAAPDIIIRNLTMGWPGHIILEDANIHIPAGKITVILGGSGDGKSTLLRHILGLNTPFSGEIEIDSHCIFDLNPEEGHALRASMGVLFQNGAMLGSLSLGENVAMPLREHTELDEETIETVVRLKLNLVGLEQFMEYYPNQLSGGMRKRAGLARALVLDPRILLCDEPTAGLDPITAAAMDQLILDMHATFNMTIVVVTHDLDSMFAIAEHVVALHAGAVIFQGTLREMTETTDPFLQKFLARQAGERDTPTLKV